MSRPQGRRRGGHRPDPGRSSPNGKPRRFGGWVGAAGVAAGAALIVVVLATLQSPSGTTSDRDPATVAEGASLFGASCAACHGQDLNGTLTGPPLLVPTYAPNHHADEAFQRAVAFGVQPHHWDFGPMAPVPGLSREEVESIIAFVRSEQEAAGVFRDPSHP